MQIHSIFESISGEAGEFPQGAWCTFIRTQGCSLRCTWCDTPEAQDPGAGKEMDIKDIVSRMGTRLVLVTGGEPLYQRAETIQLLEKLVSYGHIVQVETNGYHIIPNIMPDLDYRINWVVDYKTPSSRMQNQMYAFRSQTGQLTYGHELEMLGVWHIKFVIANIDDLFFSLNRMQELRETGGRNLKFVLSPLNANKALMKEILQFIICYGRSLLDQIIFSLQLHKILEIA